MKRLIIFNLLAALFAFKASAQTTISAKSASKHIGQTVKICDKVFSGKLVKTSNATMLNIGGDEPNQALTIMIPQTARGRFKGKPEIDYTGKDVIVTGKIATFNGKPQIVITNPKQLKVVMIDNMKNPSFKKPD